MLPVRIAIAEAMRSSGRMSTGEVAKMLAVTPDTVLKWIKRGRLAATRTAGGHYRIQWADVEKLGNEPEAQAVPAGPLVHCWEFHAETGNEPSAKCAECLVYKARAERCYMLQGVATSDSHAGTHCATSCLDCAYYIAHFYTRPRVLCVIPDPTTRQRCEQSGSSGLEMRFVDSAYDTGVAVAEFRPEYVVLHCSLAATDCSALRRRIEADPHVPGIHVLVAQNDEPRGDLPSQFTIADLQAVVWPLHRARG